MPSTSTAVGQRTSSSVKFWNASEMKFPRENCEDCFFLVAPIAKENVIGLGHSLEACLLA